MDKQREFDYYTNSVHLVKRVYGDYQATADALQAKATQMIDYLKTQPQTDDVKETTRSMDELLESNASYSVYNKILNAWQGMIERKWNEANTSGIENDIECFLKLATQKTKELKAQIKQVQSLYDYATQNTETEMDNLYKEMLVIDCKIASLRSVIENKGLTKNDALYDALRYWEGEKARVRKQQAKLNNMQVKHWLLERKQRKQARKQG